MRRALIAAAACLLLLATPATAFGEDEMAAPLDTLQENSPSSAELVERADMFDGTVVTYTGEVIGEAMQRGHWAWLHINDDAYMLRNIEEGAPLAGLNSGMPVWVPVDEAAEVGVFGDYRHEGDVVQIRGQFNAACPEHGGDMDIHAVYVDIVRPGREVTDPVSPLKLRWAMLAALFAACMFLLDRRFDRLLEWRQRQRTGR